MKKAWSYSNQIRRKITKEIIISFKDYELSKRGLTPRISSTHNEDCRVASRVQ